jgi:hypothetical protein
MSRLARLAREAAAVAALGALAIGCGPGEARSPIPTRTLDERRAVEVIRQALLHEGARPAAAREVKLSNGTPLTVDVSIEGHEYGIAYVTPEDAAQLGAAIPPRNQKDERLRLVRTGDGEARIVVLYQENYIYDDLAGEAHSQTTITCEHQLARDVADFVTHAREQGYK